jgi:hypothetical protein
MLYFNRSIFGSEKHLTYSDKKFEWKNDVERVYTSSVEFKNIAQTFDFNIPTLFPEKYVKMCENINTNNYARCIPADVIRKSCQRYCNTYDKFIDKYKDHKYLPVLETTEKFLHLLKKPEVDIIRYAAINASNVNLPGFVMANKHLNIPVYSRLNTKTGRLTVVNGPNVLTLKKNYRNMLSKSLQVDFNSMEPRLLLAILGIKIDGDLYSWVGEKTNIKEERAKLKVKIITSLYGGSKIKEINDLFAVDEWNDQLQKSVKNNRIENYFGRVIDVSGAEKNNLLALYIQSSAVDASLLGFNWLVNNYNLDPYWIIHDALIFKKTDIDLPRQLKITDDIFLPVEYSEI